MTEETHDLRSGRILRESAVPPGLLVWFDVTVDGASAIELICDFLSGFEGD